MAFGVFLETPVVVNQNCPRANCQQVMKLATRSHAQYCSQILGAHAQKGSATMCFASTYIAQLSDSTSLVQHTLQQ